MSKRNLLCCRYSRKNYTVLTNAFEIVGGGSITGLSKQGTLAVGGSITMWLVSRFTSLDSAASLHTKTILGQVQPCPTVSVPWSKYQWSMD